MFYACPKKDGNVRARSQVNESPPLLRLIAFYRENGPWLNPPYGLACSASTGVEQ